MMRNTLLAPRLVIRMVCRRRLTIVLVSVLLKWLVFRARLVRRLVRLLVACLKLRRSRLKCRVPIR